MVLVLEKDRGRLFRYEEILAALGYEPIGFTTLREVPLADAARARFDAALVCHQPGTNSALEFAAALHDIAPSLPIILVTPSARDLDAPILVTSGISEVVHDPVTSGELAGALSRCLNSRNERLWNDRSWHISDIARCLLLVRYAHKSGHQSQLIRPCCVDAVRAALRPGARR